MDPPDHPVDPAFTNATDRRSYLESLLSTDARREYQELRDRNAKAYEADRENLEKLRANWEAEHLLQQRPRPPWQFSSQQEKRLQAAHAVEIRIQNELSRVSAKYRKAEMDFLERAARPQQRTAHDPEREAKKQMLLERFRSAADRRRNTNDRDNGRGR